MGSPFGVSTISVSSESRVEVGPWIDCIPQILRHGLIGSPDREEGGKERSLAERCRGPLEKACYFAQQIGVETFLQNLMKVKGLRSN